MTTTPNPTRLLSIQVAPWAILNEGIDAALDFMCECGLNAIHLNTHTYYGGGGGNQRGFEHWATDHPGEPGGHWRGQETGAWLAHDPARYAEVGLFHDYEGGAPDSTQFDAICAAVQARGMRVYARYLDGIETHRHRIPGWQDVLSVDADGNCVDQPCFIHPRLREWNRLTLEDIGAHPALDGVLFGIERGSPLEGMLYWGGHTICFCEHCEAEARRRGFDIERARLGFQKIKKWLLRFKNDPNYMPDWDPRTRLVQIYQEFPEIWEFNQMQTDAQHALERESAEAFHRTKPQGEFSALTHPTHNDMMLLDHELTKHTGHCDALAPRLYSHVHGPRMVDICREQGRTSWLRPYSEATRWELMWRAYAGPTLPVPTDLDAVHAHGIPAEAAVARFRNHIATADQPRPIQALIGLDIVYPPNRRATPRDYTYAVCEGTLQAGARDIVLCREYQEVSGENMKTAAQALQNNR